MGVGPVTAPSRELSRGDTQARSALLLGGAMIGVATWLVLVHHPRWGGAAAGGAALLLVFGSVRASATEDRVLRFLDSVLDRAFDGAILPAIALTMRHEDRVVAALAVVAIGVSFTAAYIRAKGKALGYTVRDSLLLRAARYVAVAVGLATDGLLGALIAVLALTTFTAIDNSGQVASEGRRGS
jgi:hypothetical protein